MKKKVYLLFILMIFLCFVFLLGGCSNKKTLVKIENDEVVNLILHQKNAEDRVGSYTLRDFYHLKTNLDLTILEGAIDSKTNMICGYIDNVTIAKIGKMNMLAPEDVIFTKGIDSTFTMYQTALYHNIISLEDNPIYLYDTESVTNIPKEYEEKTLIFVLNLTSVHFNNGKNLQHISSLSGKIKNNKFVLDDVNPKFLNNKIIIPESKISNYMDEELFEIFSIEVTLYNEKLTVAENAISFSLDDYGKELFEIFTPAIISEEKELKPNTQYYFDYLKIKEILQIR